MSTIAPQSALVYAMVLVSAVDRSMSDAELERIGETVRLLPAFSEYEQGRVLEDAKTCAEILDNDDGLEAVIGLMKEAVPDAYGDLVYAVACEVAAVDGSLVEEELRLLEILRHRFDVDRLTAAAIERGVAARRKIFPAD